MYVKFGPGLKGQELPIDLECDNFAEAEVVEDVFPEITATLIVVPKASSSLAEDEDEEGVQIEGVPVQFALDQNYPNPFNPETQIRYALPEAAHARLVVYDVLGREVKVLIDQEQSAGYHVAVWDATNQNGIPVTTGMYFYRLTAGSFTDLKKMVLMR